MSSPPNNKENLAPLTASDSLQHTSGSSPKKTGRRGRSKSIGPGGIDEINSDTKAAKSGLIDAKSRRKSAFVSTVKSILPTKEDEAKRKAERRKSLANRRVSFAPEATLHTWDVIEYMRDHTTSTESSDSTRRASAITRNGTPQKGSPMPSSDDAGPPSTPPEQEDEPAVVPSSPAPQRELHQKKSRRSSGIPPMNFNNPDEASSPSGVSGSSDVSDGESDDEAVSEEDATGTAMSLDVDDSTRSSDGSGSSTSSSARLEAALRQAADAAGTRGIDYDEHGEMSMELASEEVTNAFQPWAQRRNNEAAGSAADDQENVNPFSPAFKSHMASGTIQRPSTVQEEDEEDMSMDVTKAVGGILAPQQGDEELDSEGGGDTMELTQAFSKVQGQTQAQKRRRSTTEAGSPAVTQAKRRRSSAARSSMGDDTMDLTVAVGGIQSQVQPAMPTRRRSLAKRQSSGIASDTDATMDLTLAVGSIKTTTRESTSSGDEEFSMELTAAIGGINEEPLGGHSTQPATPQGVQMQGEGTASTKTTPKDQQRFVDVQDSGPGKLLTPVFQKQVELSPRRSSPRTRSRSNSAARVGSASETSTSPVRPTHAAQSPIRTPVVSPEHENAMSDSDLRRQLDAQLHEQDVQQEPSPSALKQLRSSPVKQASTPQHLTPRPCTPQASMSQQATPQAMSMRASPHKMVLSIAENIKLLSTPRKETLKAMTPIKPTPTKTLTPMRGLTPRSTRSKTAAPGFPVNPLLNELEQLKSEDQRGRKVRLQDFLDEAGIRFMDLNTTSRRMTTAPTPSRAREMADLADEEADMSLLSGVITGTCTAPELDMYSHACRELKHYLSEGKSHIKKLEQQTYNETPSLIQVYMGVDEDQRAAIDAQLREIKTQARYQSKEMWYSWRGQLLNDLMKGLNGIGESLLEDDATLQDAELRVGQEVASMVELHGSLQEEAAKLEESLSSASEEERAELQEARHSLSSVTEEVKQQRQLFSELQEQLREQEVVVANLEDTKTEFSQAIQEADRVHEACRGVSLNEIEKLNDSINSLEESYGWIITSATSSPPTVTMTYKQRLQLFFHPGSLKQTGRDESDNPNAPISLTHNGSKPLGTTLRFFLQLLQSSLHALPQCQTRLADMLTLISTGWDTALEVAEDERRLNIEGMTDVRIVDDGRLSISTLILLSKVKTKVRATFELMASVGEDLGFSSSVETSVQVVYGEMYKEDGMTKFVNERVTGNKQWHVAVQELRKKLVSQGPKGQRK